MQLFGYTTTMQVIYCGDCMANVCDAEIQPEKELTQTSLWSQFFLTDDRKQLRNPTFFS